MKKIIYLCGPLTKMSAAQFEEYDLLKLKLTRLGHKVVTPLEHLPPDFKDVHDVEILCAETAAMAFCTEVVTMMVGRIALTLSS